MAVTYTNREVLANIVALEEAGSAIEALKVAVRALEFYAKEGNWGEDDWGCVAVITHPDYGEGGKKARNAIKRISRLVAAEATERETDEN